MIDCEAFGVSRSGENVRLYTLHGSGGALARVLDYGGTLQSILVPDADGALTDVLLGYDTLADYEENDAYLGAIVGRFANRIGGGRFTLNGTEYRLARNDGNNHLHGGAQGFDKRVWRAETDGGTLRLSRRSPDGEEGYPGALNVTVEYRFDGTALSVCYRAEAEADTILNLTSHGYFNLNGGGSVLDHTLRIDAERYTENGADTLPSGRILPVKGTPLDFRREKPLGRDIADASLAPFRGYDHNLVLRGAGFREAACLRGDRSGIELRVCTDRPGMQLYSAGWLSERRGKGGARYRPHDAVCLETQGFPDAPNRPNFPSAVLRRGEVFRSRTRYVFSACMRGADTV